MFVYSSLVLNVAVSTAAEGGKIADSLGFWSVFTLPAGIIFLLTGIGVLWDRKFRPARIAQSVPTASFSNIMRRTMKFIFIEDKYPITAKDEAGNPTDEPKYPKFAKLLVWRNLYIFLAVVSTVLTLFGNAGALYLWAFLVLVVFSRTSKVFAQRHSVLMRMYEVAASELGYSSKDSTNPWAYVNIKKWEKLTIPGATEVHFPARYKSEEQKNRENFERHFDGTVTDDNTWIYKWHSSKGLVSCSPVTHIPEFAPYPGSSKGEWNKIPLGLGTEGEVYWDVSKAPMALVTGTTGGGKSTIQRNIIFHCIQHSDRWRFLGIDVKKVELSQYVEYDPVVMGIGTSVADGLEIIRYANEEMMNRYEQMKENKVNHFSNLAEVPYALMVMVDETYMFLAQSPAKSNEEVKEENEMKGEASKLIGDIARLGRAAGVHLVLATQRPDATVIYGELKQNLALRVAAGRADTIASQMTLDNDNATRLPGNIKGRGYMQVFGEGEQFQGYFAEEDWIDKFIAGEDPDGKEGPAEAEAPSRTKERKKRSKAKKELEAPEIVSDFSNPIEDMDDIMPPEPKPKKGKGLLGKLNAYNASQVAQDGGEENEEPQEESNPRKKSKKESAPQEKPKSNPSNIFGDDEDEDTLEDPFGDIPQLTNHTKQAELLKEIKQAPAPEEDEDFVDPFGGFDSSSSFSMDLNEDTLFGAKGKPANDDSHLSLFDDEDDIFTGPQTSEEKKPALAPSKPAGLPKLPNKSLPTPPKRPERPAGGIPRPSSLPQRPAPKLPNPKP